MQAASSCICSANSNKAVPRTKSEGALSVVSAYEELGVNRERQESKQTNRREASGLITKLVKVSGSTASDCTTRELSLWPLELLRGSV